MNIKNDSAQHHFLNRYSSERYFLNPGELIVTSKDIPVVTILGSCVAITVFSPETKTGAIFHALLPEHRNKSRVISNSPPVSPDSDYVDYAFYYVREKFHQKGINFNRTKIMLFGGGDVVHSFSSGGRDSIGFQNINMAKKIIQNEGLTLHGEDVGGRNGRKLIFLPNAGKVYLEYLNNEIIPGAALPASTSLSKF